MEKPVEFFSQHRLNLFRPLAGKYRSRNMDCLLALYERVYGAGADYFAHVSHNALRALFAATIQASRSVSAEKSEEMSAESPEERDPNGLAGLLIRELREDGWIETYYDSVRISEAYRFTRDGKILTEAFMRIGRPTTLSRHRNMRACHNALQAFLTDYDVNELADAYECAQNVIEDLNENIGLIYQQARLLVQQAAATSAWSEFEQFVKRFERDIRPQLTSEHVSRHRVAIRERCAAARRIAPELIERLEPQLSAVIPWAVEERTTETTYMWLLDRIEEMVDGACNAKQPELQRALTEYTRRITGLLREVMAIRMLDPQASIDALLKRMSELEPDEVERELRHIGWLMSAANVRLIDPGTVRVRDIAARVKVSTEIRRYAADPESRARTAVAHALAGAFVVTEKEAVQKLERLASSAPIRTGNLPTREAMEVLFALHAPELARTASGATKFSVTRLKGRVKNNFYDASEYLISRNEKRNG